MRITDYNALTFDVYGTLIDWESGMVEGLQPLTDRAEWRLDRNDVTKAHARHESSKQQQTPGTRYQELPAIVYRRHDQEGFGATMTPKSLRGCGREGLRHAA